MKIRRIALPCFAVIGMTASAAFGAMAKPNVVFFLIDDLNHFGLSCYGAERVSSTQGYFKDVPLRTPHIDSLAENGLRCDQAYVTPLCESTRVALMTGMHNGRNFVRCKALHESQITFSDVFQRAGYATGMFGKWKQSRGTPEVPGLDYISQFGWDDYLCFDVHNKAKGWLRHLDPTLVENGVETRYEGLDPATGRRWFGPDLCNRAALKFIDEHKDEPFFLYYPLLLVHDEHTPTPDTRPRSAYDNFDTMAPNKFGHLKGDDRRYFPDMLAYMDKMVGRVLEKLDEHALRENTLVMVMGDNGAKACFSFAMKDGRVFVGGKGFHRDNGEHVPLIFSWPGEIPAGSPGGIRGYEGIFDVVDVYPTLLEACGIAIPNADKIDGRSAWPQITGRRPNHHRKVLYKWYNGNNPFTDVSGAVSYAQTSEFKRYAPHQGFPNGRFFDLRTDRNEEAGKRGPKVGWEHYHHHGLDVSKLTRDQQAAYDHLGKVLEVSSYTPVAALQLIKGEPPVRVGDQRQLECRIEPRNATRRNVVWQSSDPAVATVDKFGVLTARRKGRVEITAYSWDDALPVAAGQSKPYRKDGISDSVTIEIGE